VSDYVAFLIWPFVACVVLIGIHVYFGLHVIQRGIIFVDLSLAQVAALGMTVAFLMGHDLDGDLSYLFSLAFALLGGTIFTFSKDVRGRIPQEAVIGIVYAVSSAAAILAVSRSPEGADHIRHLLIGSILTVTPAMVAKTAAVYAVVGLFHWLWRSRFIPLTFNSSNTSLNRRWWDFLFYATFAVVVTSSVKICGVLLVFIFLVIPSVFAALFADGIGARLALGWAFGLVGSVLGLVASLIFDTPTGATIVCTFGALLLVLVGARRLVPR
jgi:zinc/manganese transport system permease protein